MRKPIERIAVVSRQFREDLAYWIETDRKTALRVLELMSAVLADPLRGIGKPEPLKFEWPVAGVGELPKSTAWSIE